MDDKSGNQTQPVSFSQIPPGVQPPPTSNATQSSTSSFQTTQSAVNQPIAGQQPGVEQLNVDGKSKSGKKGLLLIFASLIVFLLLVLGGMFFVLTPTVRGLSACMEENSKNMETLFQRGLQEKWTNQQKCLEFESETEKLITCYDGVGSRSILPAQLAFTLGGLVRGKEIKLDKEGLIQLHNSNCSQFPETLISD